MTPYTDSLYFSVLLYPAVVAIALGLAGRLSWRWVLGINVAMLVAQYSKLFDFSPHVPVSKIVMVTAYGIYQWTVARTFLWLRRRGVGKGIFRIAVFLVLLPLLVIKLLPVSVGATLIGFLGISYVTFRCLDVIFCIQDRLIVSLSPTRYAAFVLFFPSISAGPLDRYKRFVADFDRHRTRAEFLGDLDVAVQRLFRGLLYKFVLAALVKQYWLDPVATSRGAVGIASYMYAYTFYLFFDFAGYSAFAIAVGYLLGIHTPENFNRPFLATNIVDFWNRWHMSLSTWFRDHVYMRFIMAAMRARWLSNKLVISCLGFYMSFVLMGLWHGVAPRYLIYGLYHGTLMAGYTAWMQRRPRSPLAPRPWPRRAASMFVTFHLVCFGLLIFSGRLL